MTAVYRGITDDRFGSLNKVEREDLFRRLVYARDGGMCQLCGGSVSFENMHLDHKIARSKRGPDHAENMQVTHWVCNIRKGHKDVTETPLVQDSAFKKQVARDDVIYQNASIDDVVKVETAAKMKGVTRASIYNAINAGKLKVVAVLGGHTFLLRADVDAYKPYRAWGPRKKQDKPI